MTDDSTVGGPAQEDDWRLDEVDRRLAMLLTEVDEGFLLSGSDCRWLIGKVKAYKQGLITAYWLVHGSESGQAWAGRTAVESAITDAFTDG